MTIIIVATTVPYPHHSMLSLHAHTEIVIFYLTLFVTRSLIILFTYPTPSPIIMFCWHKNGNTLGDFVLCYDCPKVICQLLTWPLPSMTLMYTCEIINLLLFISFWLLASALCKRRLCLLCAVTRARLIIFVVKPIFWLFVLLGGYYFLSLNHTRYIDFCCGFMVFVWCTLCYLIHVHRSDII